MSKTHSILLVTSEVYPFLKTSELADLCYAHSLGVRETGHDIRVMFPKYGFISERKNRIHEIKRLIDIPIPVGKEDSLATVKSSSINNPRVKVQSYITTNVNYLDANKGVLADNTTGKEFADNDERFIFFNRTVLETCVLLGWFPDIIHCVGWQTALVPAYIRTMYANEFKKTKIVMTISDFTEQGVFSLKSLAKTGLPAAGMNAAKYKNKMNFLRAGMAFADGLTTLSPGYAAELNADKEYKANWATIHKKKKLVGMPHGIDLMQWNPKTDPFLRSKFDAKDTTPKGRVREQLQRSSGMKVDHAAMVVSYIGPLTKELGAEILLAAIPSIIKTGVQVLIATDIPTEYSKQFQQLAKKSAGALGVKVGMDEEFVHNTLAGSAAIIKAPKSEASGQFQRCALRYGTIPILRVTGGISEGMTDVIEATTEGNAFLFKKADAKEVAKTVERAFALFNDAPKWQKIMINAMGTNVAWTNSAKPYDEYYRNIVKESK
ncbi:MAG: glycogen synthase [Ignavibacteria bacterium]|nr:glycogen synthase [Ignavibacteria bacterium]